MLGWPPLFLVKNEAAPPSAASLRPLPPLLIFITVSVNGHTRVFFSYIGLLHSSPAFAEGGVASSQSIYIPLLLSTPIREEDITPAHHPTGLGMLGWEGAMLSPQKNIISIAVSCIGRKFRGWNDLFSSRQEGMVTWAALLGSLACQCAHEHLKYRWKRGDGVLVCRFMQILFIHQMSTWLSLLPLPHTLSGW